jgi:hypothetical protein
MIVANHLADTLLPPLSELPLRSDAASPQHQHCREISAAAWFLSGIRRAATKVVETTRGISFADVILGPIALAIIILDRMGDIAGSSETHGTHVSTFYSGYSDNGEIVAIPTSFIACLFGAIHCAGWFFIFPTIIESTIWRVFSGIITAAPLITMLWAFLLVIHDRISIPDFVQIILVFLLLLSLLLYVVARFGLLVVALITLRDLPPSAYDIVTWTTFLPHI